MLREKKVHTNYRNMRVNRYLLSFQLTEQTWAHQQAQLLSVLCFYWTQEYIKNDFILSESCKKLQKMQYI